MVGSREGLLAKSSCDDFRAWYDPRRSIFAMTFGVRVGSKNVLSGLF